MRALIVPDLHIGKGTSIGKDPIGVGLNSRVEDQKELLDFISKLVVSENVTHIFLLGDIWESANPKSSLVKLFFSWVRDLRYRDKEVFIIMGNHDFVRSGSDRVSMLHSLKALEISGVHVITNITSMGIDDNHVVFLPFCDRKQIEADSLQEAIEIVTDSIQKHNTGAPSESHILLGHMAIDGSLWVGDEIDQSANEIFLPLDSFNGFDFVWMGHIHKWQILQNNNPHIAHVGSLDKTSFIEKEKYVAFFDSKTRNYRYIQLPCRNLIDINVSVDSTIKDATAALLKEISNIDYKLFNGAIVRINVKLNSHDTEQVDKEKIADKLSKLGVFHLSSFMETRDVDRVLIKNANLDETIDHMKAVDVFVETITADNQFKSMLIDVCKLIIKEYTDNN